MSQISVNHLTFYYEGSYDNIFEDVSFQIDTDWKLGFIGRNGKGKTTFLNLLMGKHEYIGTISSLVEFDYFPFEIKDKSKNTIDIIEELEPDYEFWKICRELNYLQVEGDVFYRPFETLSCGEQTKVLLALLFTRENHFLLIDEPTNHLDMETRDILKNYLNTKKGFILVSHDRSFMDGCIDHVLVLNRESIEVLQGNFTSWWENKKKQDAYELAENERLKKDIRRLTEAARTTKQWADKVEGEKIGFRSGKYEKMLDKRAYIGEKSRRMQQRRKNLEHRQEKEIEEKSALLKNLEKVEDLKLFPLKHYKEKLVIMENCRLIYSGQKENPSGIRVSDVGEISQSQRNFEKEIVNHFHLEIKQGDRIFLQGKNGCGKSSILKAILAETPHLQTEGCTMDGGMPLLAEGKIMLASGLIISYCTQDTSGLSGTIQEYAEKNNIDITLLMALLRKLDFSRLQFEKRMEDYSGGQKKKVLLAASLCRQAHLYIWDEPLNYIDVFSRMQIEELILRFQPTMIMVEHDKAFMKNTATGIVRL